MLTCIACSKNQHQHQHQQLSNGGSLRQQLQEEDDVGTPRTKQAIKTLTAQVLLLLISEFISSVRKKKKHYFCLVPEKMRENLTVLGIKKKMGYKMWENFQQFRFWVFLFLLKKGVISFLGEILRIWGFRSNDFCFSLMANETSDNWTNGNSDFSFCPLYFPFVSLQPN